MSDTVQNLLAKNQAYAADNYGIPPNFDTLSSLPRNQAVAIISCMDPRLVPEEYFKFHKGEYPVIRVAGGRVKDALRSLLVLEHHLGLGGVAVVHHTDCGMTHASDAEFKATFKARAATAEQVAEIDAIDFDEIHSKDVRASVKSDVKYLKESPWFGKEINIVGLVFDLNTGKVEQVQ
ncbi:carbonic anhydrase [Coniophora puteana RWD-64-598 SS2]|uniref:Carbonic anhydrase n=1 Tax=Coniophora puteana (strain RWD-64-598) TaxID=741705 RepID=A0A5M3N3H6_CONPW|nr:carbonic anhydrase [Coniophora puteana RWD-64-598 SS2]EIW85950.1 carbonic anhydrase [Coniophora puteana RWD-64-598 SS2]